VTDPLVTGPAVILSGRWLAVARQALLVAQTARKRNGLAECPHYAALLDALTSALSPPRLPDTPDLPSSTPMTTEAAAEVLGMSKRQVQRRAGQLGGRLVGGRWLLDPAAVHQHREGQQ